MSAGKEVRLAIRAVRAARRHLQYARSLSALSHAHDAACLAYLQKLANEEAGLAQLLKSLRLEADARPSRRRAA